MITRDQYRETIRLGRLGMTWPAIADQLGSTHGSHSAAWARNASAEDRDVRKCALLGRPTPQKQHRTARHDGPRPRPYNIDVPMNSRGQPPVGRQRGEDIFTGQCFANDVAGEPPGYGKLQRPDHERWSTIGSSMAR